SFYHRHLHKFTDIIEGRVSAADPMDRPHVRFDGDQLSELPEKWSHAQNDALGYLLWLVCELVAADQFALTAETADVVTALVHYWQAIRFWEDEDSGHWEEARKIEASSVGTAVAGLRGLRNLLDRAEVQAACAATRHPVSAAIVDELNRAGTDALNSILPAECVQPDPKKNRQHDAALLFLIWPLNVVDRRMAETIVQQVKD
ncbi:MAG: phosphorylase kinase, partial [Planctomycetaceae bacterium]|nr:phosphorylase kinase [Planctomycetaceae bacterium]